MTNSQQHIHNAYLLLYDAHSRIFIRNRTREFLVVEAKKEFDMAVKLIAQRIANEYYAIESTIV